MRNFNTGATRDSDENKYDYEGFLSPAVLEAYAAYMHKNRFQADGNIRDSDNWQKGIPKDVYIKSMFRHFMTVWKGHREGYVSNDELAALLFNVMGYMFEQLKPITATEVENNKREHDDSFKLRYEDGGVKSVDINEYSDNALRFLEAAATTKPYSVNDKRTLHDHFTHRYGALAHDQTAIDHENDLETSEEEDDEEENIQRSSACHYTAPLPPQGYGQYIIEDHFYQRRDGAIVGPYKTETGALEARAKEEGFYPEIECGCGQAWG